MNFWSQLNRGFLLLAPMEDVTDSTFREIVIRNSDPSILRVVFTEFTSVDGLLSERGFERVSERLWMSDSERKLLRQHNIKIVAQIWGNDPEKFYNASKLVSGMGLFDGIDINMGCPVKKVVKKNCCAALIKNPQLANAIIRATIEGTKLPVSVKTRIGFNKVETTAWISNLLGAGISAITIHGRTQKMQSDGAADWYEIEKAVALRNMLNPHVRIIGNGDVFSHDDAIKKVSAHKVDGVMIGRGIFHNPWIFNHDVEVMSPELKMNTMLRHVKLYRSHWENRKSFQQLKRFFKIYLNGFEGAAELRKKFMNASNFDETLQLLSAEILQLT